MAANPFDQFDAAPATADAAPAAPATPAAPANPFDQFDAPTTTSAAPPAASPATHAQPQDAQLSGNAPILVTGHRAGPLTDSSGHVILQDAEAIPQGQDTGFIGENGGTHTEADPRFAGANNAVQAMLKNGTSDSHILDYLKGLGASDQDLVALVPQLAKIREFQQSNPRYKGKYVVDLERAQKPNSVLQNVMGSDVGAGVTSAVNMSTGDNLAHIAGALGADQGNVQTAMDASAAVHPKSSIVGDIAGGAGASLGIDQALGATAIPGLARVAPEAAEGIATAAPYIRPAVADAIYGGVTGASSTNTGADGQPATAIDRLEGAGEGAAAALAGHVAGLGVGSAAGAAGNRIAGEPVTEATTQVARDANDLGIELPAFTVGGPRAQAKAQKIANKGGFGAPGLGKSAQTALDQSQAARDQIASTVGQPQALDASLGQDLSAAAIAARTADRDRIGRMYDSGDAQLAQTDVPLTQTKQTLSDLVSGDDKAIVSSPAAPLIKQMQQRIDDLGGSMSAPAVRASMRNLKASMSANGIDATTSDHILGQVNKAMQGDLETAAKSSGNESALQTYQDANQQWAASKLLDQSVLKPMLGSAFTNNGDQVVNALKGAVKNNGTRVAQLLNSVPDDLANTARASLVARMGTTSATGDAFDLPTFLKNWNDLGGSRKLIFPPDTVKALDKLANVAQYGKALQTVAQAGAKAQPGSFMSIAKSPAAVLGESASLFLHSPKEAAAGLAVASLQALGQWRAAKLLASPDFANRLGNMPMNPQGAFAFWNRPWVTAMAAKNPQISDALLSFRKAVNDNFNQYGRRGLTATGSATGTTLKVQQ